MRRRANVQSLLSYVFQIMIVSINASTLSGFKQLLNLDTVKPAVENSLSLEVEVAGTHKTYFATSDKIGNLV